MIKIPTKISGHIKLEIITANGDVRFRSEFNNLVLNEGLNYVMSANWSPLNTSAHCNVGTKITEPTESDTFATAELVGTNMVSGPSSYNWNSSGDYAYAIRQYYFTPNNNIDGHALAEIVFSYYNFVAWSRTLIKDANGNPTTITLADDEYLKLVYELRVYPPTGDTTGVADIGGDTYDYTVRPYRRANQGFLYLPRCVINGAGVANTSTAVLVAESDEAISYTGYRSSANSLADYNQDSYYRRSTFIWTPSEANISGGISVLIFAGGYPYYCFQALFVKQGDPDPTYGTNIPKDDTKTFSITVGGYIARREPEYARGAVNDGATTSLILKFDNEVLPASPTIAAFTVDINSGTNNVVTNVTTSGTTLTITVTDAIVNGDTITFSYVKATGNLVGSDDAEVENITDATVVNNVT